MGKKEGYKFFEDEELKLPIPGGDTISVRVFHAVSDDDDAYTDMEIRFASSPGWIDFEGSDWEPEVMIENAAEYFDDCAKKIREHKEELAQACYRFTEQAREELGDDYEWWY